MPAVSVALALARVEGRKLLRHPAFLIGALLTPWMLLMATSDTSESFLHLEVNTALALVPLGWLAMVATNLGALRSRRHGTEDLLESLPATASTRTAAHSLSALATVPVSVAFAAGWSIWMQVHADPRGSHRPAELAVGMLLVVGGGVLGVTVARWLPRAFVCLPAIVATIFIEGKITDLDPNPARWLNFLVEPLTSLPDLELRPAGWHLGWLAAWIVLVAVVAVARHGRGRTLGAVALGAAVVAAGTGWVQTRPLSQERAAFLADYLARPAAHQTCTGREPGSVRYCAYDDLGRQVADWRPPVEGVLAALPASVRRRGLMVRERPNPVIGTNDCTPIGLLDALPSSVRDRLTPEGVWPADGAVHPGTDSWPCSDSDSVDGLFLGVQTGAWAVGLPPGPGHLDEHCRASGQARAVAALWLGAQSTPGAAQALTELREQSDSATADHLSFADWDNPPAWSVAWSAADVAAALALLERPSGAVAAVLGAGWDRFVDPATSASELLSQAGVEGQPDSTPVPAGRPGTCP